MRLLYPLILTAFVILLIRPIQAEMSDSTNVKKGYARAGVTIGNALLHREKEGRRMQDMGFKFVYGNDDRLINYVLQYSGSSRGIVQATSSVSEFRFGVGYLQRIYFMDVEVCGGAHLFHQDIPDDLDLGYPIGIWGVGEILYRFRKGFLLGGEFSYSWAHARFPSGTVRNVGGRRIGVSLGYEIK